MKLSILMPCSGLNRRIVDEAFREEYEAWSALGVNVHLIDIDDIEHAKIISSTFDHPVLYRGWMITVEQYAQLNDRIPQLITSVEHYKKAHHIDGWVNVLGHSTFNTILTTEETIVSDFESSGWDMAFVKDYVKSLKTGRGSIVHNALEIQDTLADMKKYRATIEGGFALREVVMIDKATETRFFVYQGKLYAPHKATADMTHYARAVAPYDFAPFFSMDVVITSNGYKVIEIGDGQVSDTVGWNIHDFMAIFTTKDAR